MYDGIFEDVEHVKEVLASHGHTSVDETLVFELLEDLKVTEHVVKVLLGTRLKLTSNSPDISWSPNRSIQLNSLNGEARASDSHYLSDAFEDSNSSDCLEVLEPNLAIRLLRPKASSDAVDLTMDDNRSVSSSNSSSSSKKSRHSDTEIKAKGEPVDLVADSAGPLIDLTTEAMEVVKEGCCKVENLSEKTYAVKSEEADGNNSATDSESEMDDYYRRGDEESEEFEEFSGSEDKVSSPSVSPALEVGPDFEIRADGEAERLETGGNRIEEMLEENNNDPNNNLEDIEGVMEQNNAASSITEDLNIQKESSEARCRSPKPGCSKDSYYADTDFCMTDDTGAQSSENQKFIAGKRENVANIFEDQDFLVGNCVRLSDTKIGQDVFMIQKMLPQFTKAKILSKVMENQDAVNRVEIALWKLLPDHEPAPIFHPKRKQAEDNCPAPTKKFLQDELALKKNSKACIGKEPAKIEEAAPAPKTTIIKPATLKVLGTKKIIVKPPKFEFPIYRSLLAAETVSKSGLSGLLKPSKLEHLKMPNRASDQLRNISVKTYGKSSDKDNKTGAIPNRPKSATQVFRTEVGIKQSNFDNFSPLPKAPMPIEAAAGTSNEDEVTQCQSSQPSAAAAKEQKDSDRSKIQNTGTIPKKVDQKIAKRKKELRESVLTGTGAAAKVAVSEPSHSENSKPLLLGQNVRPANNAAFHNNQIGQLDSSNARINELRGKILAASDPTKPDLTANNPPQIVKKAVQIPEELPANHPKLIQRDANCTQIVQNVKNMKLEKQILVGNRATKNIEGPKDDHRLQPPPQRQPHPQLHTQLQQPPLLQPQLLPPAAPAWVQQVQQPVQRQPQPGPNNDIEEMRIGTATAKPMATVGVEQLERGRIEKQEVPPPQELFNPLINMFPDVDPNYISELCISAKRRNEGLESLVEILLINGAIHPRVINPEPEPQEINPDAQYENLQGIFPDAHPEYLRGIAEQYYNDPEAMKNFVQAKLENSDYPTMAEHLKKIKMTEQIRQYTDDFSAEKFLQIFPDPWAHFENPKRVHRYNVIAFEFLKCIFRCTKVATITRAYRSSKHPFHLSLAAKSLEIIGPDMKSRRSDKLLPCEDIPLLQEFAFIKHKAEIKEYISVQKLKEKQEFERLKENNELIECGCCYDGECMPSKCLTCSEGHVFCKSCIKTGSETKIGEGQTQFGCFVECKGEFTLPVLQKVLEPTMFSILLRKRQEEEVKAAGLEGLVSCPFCHFASIPPPEDKVFKCLNPECMKETCRLCKELNHVPLRCDEVNKGEEARHYLEEKMTEALVRKCYRCSRPFFKDEGCNKMTCPCGAMTCYICGQPVKDYKHFNGQGSDRTDLCPLWSDNQVLNAQTVRAVAEEAEKEILKKNPHLKIDAKALMPTVPRATTGPHQHIANAHVLPVQARRA